MYAGYEGSGRRSLNNPVAAIWGGWPAHEPGEIDWASFAASGPRRLSALAHPYMAASLGDFGGTLEEIVALKQQSRR